MYSILAYDLVASIHSSQQIDNRNEIFNDTPSLQIPRKINTYHVTQTMAIIQLPFLFLFLIIIIIIIMSVPPKLPQHNQSFKI